MGKPKNKELIAITVYDYNWLSSSLKPESSHTYIWYSQFSEFNP